MAYIGFELDIILSVYLLIAVGIVVDYVAHMAYSLRYERSCAKQGDNAWLIVSRAVHATAGPLIEVPL